ncbi:hypothetical protein BDZ91DRAFT_725335 [Kalaharituber pfeilii]|nr:hypothetical protein BDZ91DRAFT_725335 [Kalaharituber pfeilii]
MPQYDTQNTLDSVTVPRKYLEDLKKSQREYNALRSALIRGGVTVESLDLLMTFQLLVQETYDQTIAAPAEPSDDGVSLFEGRHSGLPLNIMQQAPAENQYYMGHLNQGFGALSSPTWNFNNPTGPSNDYGPNGHSAKIYDRSMDFGVVPDHLSDQNTVRNGTGRRTLYLTKLPDRITYGQIFSVIRGGAVVDVWMKSSDHAASVSFVECSAAESFYQYAKRNDIYIDGRRINVDWREPSRQFVILNNIMSAISRGATRNLLLSKIPQNLTEARIREDLDHIHNLHVEKVEIRGDSMLVNLNSVCVALFARTCLMSRGAYKGVKIEFAPDECAGKLPAPKRIDERKNLEKKAAPKNRFDILAMPQEEGDGEEDEQDGEDENTSEDATEKEESSLSNTSHTFNAPRTNGNTNGYTSNDKRKSVNNRNNGRGSKRGWGQRTNGY